MSHHTLMTFTKITTKIKNTTRKRVNFLIPDCIFLAFSYSFLELPLRHVKVGASDSPRSKHLLETSAYSGRGE